MKSSASVKIETALEGKRKPRRSWAGSRSRGVSLLEILFVVAATLVLSAISAPKVLTIRKSLMSQSDARTISGETSLAKMRAASDFTHVRLHADFSGNFYELDVWNKGTSQWVTEQASVKMLPSVTLGFGSLANPPAGTQAILGQAKSCLNNAGTAIVNTACIVFNSRGIPVDSTGNPTATGAIYVTDGVSVYGITVSAMGLIQTWKCPANSTSAATWVKF
jgi:Tfp pilus assembly protein FimT